jgi:hypothetical protein
VQMRNATVALFVRICFPVVRVEREVAIRSWIDPHLGDRLNLIRTLDRFPQEQNRTGAYKQRQRINRTGSMDSLTTVEPLVGPVVIPIGACRQINRPTRYALLGDRSISPATLPSCLSSSKKVENKVENKNCRMRSVPPNLDISSPPVSR